jgi:hypothetical protein
MSVTKKSLISNREVAKKAAIASNVQQTGDLKASALTAHTMKKKTIRFTGVAMRVAKKA